MKKSGKQGHATALTATTAFAEMEDKKIAYRIIGSGNPIILCNRFRGNLDTWDPAFLDKLAKKFQVIIFDYSGVGLSSGELPTDMATIAKDVKDLADLLKLKRFIIGGWSYGGLVAQTFTVQYPKLVTHTILIGTKPAGKVEFGTEKLFYETSSRLENTLNDETILFFEPESELSRHAAEESHQRIRERKTDTDVAVPEKTWKRYFEGTVDFTQDKLNVREKLAQLQIPILVISGDHDIVFPIENWYALTRKLPNLQIIMLPQAGHAPQHQYAALTAKYITHFVNHFKLYYVSAT